MEISYSRVETYKKCPFRYKLLYLDELVTIPDLDKADNALYLGSCVHRAIETNNVELAVNEYYNKFPIINDDHYTESLKMELILEKVMPMIPSGKHEVEIRHTFDDINFLGFIDLLTDEGDIIDFKYTVNKSTYLDNPMQLSIYKYFAEKCGYKIRNLYYLFIPKLSLKIDPTESLQQYRHRIEVESKDLKPELIEVKYQEKHIADFINTINKIKLATEFKKDETGCFLCSFKKYCESKGEINYMILPSIERRDISKVTKHKAWIYGAPFSGKTSFLDKAPNPLNLNTDGNVNFVSMPVIPIKDEVTTNGRLVNRKFAWDVFKDAITELEKGENQFKTIIIDLVDDIREACRVYQYDKLKITHESDSGFGKAYDVIKTEFLTTMKRFFNLPYENLIIVSHEDTSRDITKKSGQNITRIAPNIQQALANKLAGMVDIVARVVVEEDGSRTLNFKSDEVVFGGGRLKGIKTTKIPLDWESFMKVYNEANQVEENKPQQERGSRI